MTPRNASIVMAAGGGLMMVGSVLGFLGRVLGPAHAAAVGSPGVDLSQVIFASMTSSAISLLFLLGGLVVGVSLFQLFRRPNAPLAS